LTATPTRWAFKPYCLNSEVRLYGHLFREAEHDLCAKDFWQNLNPDSLKVAAAYVELPLAQARSSQMFQFECCGHFVVDRQTTLQK
jgi:glutaminyl-tRNA synthetase